MNQMPLHHICVATPGKGVYSETFIQAHIDRLPARVFCAHTGYFPMYTGTDKFLLPIIHSSVNRFLARLSGMDREFFNLRIWQKYPQRLRQWAFIRFLKKNNIRAVLAEFGPTGVELWKPCQHAGVPLIVHFHGYDAHNLEKVELYGPGYPALFESAFKIVAVSKNMENKLVELGAPREKIVCNPCGADIAFFHESEPHRNPPIFIAVGRLVAIKGPEITILAFEKVYRKYPDARLIMIGDGVLRESCEQMVQALGLESSVEFKGALSHTETRDLFSGARAFVQHSMKTRIVESEGSPVSLVEAGASALPAIVSRCGGMSDVVLHQETGFLVNQGDIETMANYMEKMIVDPDLARKMGFAARKRIQEHYSMDIGIDRLWRVIQDAIESR